MTQDDMRRPKRYYDPGANPQPQRAVFIRQPVLIGKVTRQLRRQAKGNPKLAAFIAEYDRRKALEAQGLLP